MKLLKDKKVSLYRKTDTAESGDMPHIVYKAVAANIWAYYRQLSGNELSLAKTTGSAETVLFRINYRSGLDLPGLYLKFRDKLYKITRVDDYEGYKKDLTLYGAYDTYSSSVDIVE